MRKLTLSAPKIVSQKYRKITIQFKSLPTLFYENIASEHRYTEKLQIIILKLIPVDHKKYAFFLQIM